MRFSLAIDLIPIGCNNIFWISILTPKALCCFHAQGTYTKPLIWSAYPRIGQASLYQGHGLLPDAS